MYYVLIRGPSYGNLPFEEREKIREELRKELEAQGIRFLEYNWIWDEDDRCLLLVGQYERMESASLWIQALKSMGFSVCTKTQLPGDGSESGSISNSAHPLHLPFDTDPDSDGGLNH